jgi:hypothetical protein
MTERANLSSGATEFSYSDGPLLLYGSVSKSTESVQARIHVEVPGEEEPETREIKGGFAEGIGWDVDRVVVMKGRFMLYPKNGNELRFRYNVSSIHRSLNLNKDVKIMDL